MQPEGFSLVVHPGNQCCRQRHIPRKVVRANSRRQRPRALATGLPLGQIRTLPMDSRPSFALAEPVFPLRALAGAAARAPLGGARESLTATLVVARLAAVAHGPDALGAALRGARAAAAQHWMGALTLPAPVRSALAQLVAASVAGEPAALKAALAKVTEVTAAYLDKRAHSELDRLARGIGG